MSFDPKWQNDPERLESELRLARTVTPELISAMMAGSGVRLTGLGPAAKARLGRLIAAGAWLDAALALIELELPYWKLRRIAYDDGEWFCTLAKEPLLPLGLGEIVEAAHELMPLAILMTLVRARHAAAEHASGVTTVPQLRLAASHIMGCENFA